MKRRTIGIVAFVLVAAGLLAWAGGARAITDTAFTYSNPKTFRLNLHAMAFAPDGFSDQLRNGWTDGITSNMGDACANASVNLPHGAIVTDLTLWYTSTVSGLPNLTFFRTRISDSKTDAIGAFTTPNTSGTRKSSAVTLDANMTTINNNSYWYSVGICVRPNSTFQGVRIIYTVTNAGD